MTRRSSLTPNQVAALATDRHLSVTANAGSGKTTVLVRRFIDIIRTTDCAITELVAITFTDKAAGELRNRIARSIEEELAATRQPVERARLLRARDKLASAQIHTIHGFCSRILREYPVEAEVDAGFTVLEEIDAGVMLEQAIREVFEDLLSRPDDGDTKGLLSAIRMLGRRNVETYLARLVRSRDVLDRLTSASGLDHPEADASVVAGFWRSAVERYLIGVVDSPGWRTSLQEFLAAVDGKGAQKVREQLRSWSAADPPDGKIRLYAAVRREVLTKEGDVRASIRGKSALSSYAPLIADFLAADGVIGDVVDAYDNPSAAEGDAILAGTVRSLLRCCARVLELYGQRKLEQGRLDFQDLQLNVRRLLTQPAIREEIARRMRFIMVDEYQDTDVLQYEILRELITGDGAPLLYVVGDPKQSIYSFRHADVRMFRRTREEIAGMNLASGSTESGSIVLPESFRLLGDNVAFVNHLFRNIMSDADGDGASGYEDLVKGRATAARGGVELMLVAPRESPASGEEGSGEEPRREDDPVALECSMIARRLLRLKREGTTIFESRNGEECAVPFDFRHAAILLRGREHLRKLEASLERAQIPYVVSGGIGYYQTQEVTDFHNYFRFLLDQADDVSLVGLLRSPFFIVSDTELYRIGRPGGGETFWEQTRRYARGREATDTIRWAVDILERNLMMANRLPIPVLVQNMFRETGWHATVAGRAFGTQRLANVQKLIRFAREFEAKGLTNLYDVVSRLGVLVRQEMREGQAAVESRQNCVNIMTIHGAKGLEFPVVFLPFLHKGPNPGKSPYINPDLGIAFDVARPGRLDEAVVPLFTTFLKNLSARQSLAEQKRILYVACTRGRDLLICSGQEAGRAKSGSAMSWILGACLSGSEQPIGKEIALPAGSMKVLTRTGAVEEIPYSMVIPVLRDGDLCEQTRAGGQSVAGPGVTMMLAVDPLSSTTKGEVYSATQIVTYIECPRKFYLKHRLGLQERFAPSFRDDEDEVDVDSLKGNVEGTIIHAVLQQCVDGFPEEEALREMIRRHARAVTGDMRPVGEPSVDELFSLLARFAVSPSRRMIESAASANPEFTITSCLGNDFVTGTLDLLCRMQDDAVKIIDYKTDRLTARTAEERKEHYLQQLRFYAMLVRRLFGKVPLSADLVFLRNPEYTTTFTFHEGEIREYEARVENVIRQIREQQFEMNKESCPNCGYFAGGQCLARGW